MTPWVKRLLVANVVMFFVMQALPPLVLNELIYYPLRPVVEGETGRMVGRPDLFFKPWTLVTYMFLHGDVGHLFFNMIGLYFFGPRLEERLGGNDFLKLYFLSGLGGAVLSLGFITFAGNAPIIGASGAVYGVLLGFALIWPNETIYLMAILPIQAWLLAVLLVVGSLWAGFTGAQAGVAHFAHLGGLVFGFAYLKTRSWRKGSAKREFRRKLESAPGAGSGSTDRGALKRWETIDVESLHELNREEVVTLLERARADGPRSLSQSERQFLDRMVAASS